ncbi:ABC-F family ATP-binding cassette domain-containing protein [Deinococcus peraridilitoris]|uniref:ATPase component of ABC transporters with duplicated ATPase domain protein n=1 Tax=Deinococcus peraridilitoris (strain DSM 19664 / LMG 22246 / CIP 109416 / KR-200) TaxID=937777 RepID=L0A6W2_DEIPD|nr:ABC-F family ATP-binding cassette domain-containing protein [Deinococcus peraridilitoris]AFZ68780.1 ATPase component of ABC transporters with duplicated ATPase domain protein [Deinococcus peraridilitoris DSM 19664]
MLLALDNVHKEYGAHTVLGGVTLTVRAGDRLALVGRNGAGKSTLLRLLTGEEVPDAGEVRRAAGVRAASLKQDPTFPEGATVESVLEAAFHELDALEAELNEAAQQMASGSDEAIEHHAELLEHFARRGGFERRSRKDAAALAFGFRGREGEQVSGLSGGERTRLGLAALLVENPDVLLLDEPTNHLDIVMIEWMEGFLSRYSGAVMLISHDRAFLDAVSTSTAYLRDGELKVYPGSYSTFRAALEADLERQLARFEQEQDKIDALARSTARMKIWGLGMSKLARRAKAMETRLERMKSVRTSAPPPEERTARILFHAPPSGELVLDARHLTKRLAGRTLFENVSVTIRQGERVALIGRNGAGKTTFLRCLLGLTPSDDPRSDVRTGARVKVGYYDQQLRGVDPSNTVYQEARAYTEKDTEAHNLLGTFLFPYDAHAKRVGVLSGGERARLALLKLAQEDNNLLVLDEPSNHLDMEMLESVETALDEFGGTLLMVSHDRRLIEHLADRIWLLEDGRLYEYPGGYAYYKEKHVPVGAKDEAVRAAPREREKRGPSLWHLKRRAEELEAAVAAAEQKLEAAQASLSAASEGADWGALGNAVAAAEAELLATMSAWESAQEDVEARA